MAITTDRTITVHGVEVGISKPIQTLIANGDFTFAELSKYAIVGRHDFVNNIAGVFEPDNYYQQADSSADISELEKYPVLNSPTAPGWDSVLYTYFGSGNRSYDNYGKMVLVYNMTNSINIINKNFNDNNEACIVTEFNPRLIKMLGNVYTGTVNADAGDTGTYTIYEPEGSRSFVWMDDDTSAPFSSLCIQNLGDAYYFDFPLYNSIFNAEQTISGNRDSTYVNLLHIFDDYMATGNKLLSVWCDGGIDDFLVGANYGARYVGAYNMSDDRGDKIVYVNYIPYGATIYTRATSLDTALKQLAGCGFYFDYDGTTYKPIAEGGIVTGYTSELDKNGEWDLINDVTGNTVPDKPSGGGGGGDDDDPSDNQAWGGAYSGAGAFAKFYLCSETDLANLRSWFGNSGSGGSDEIPDGFDPMGQVLGLLQYPVSIAGTALAPEEIVFRSGKTIIHTGVNADRSTGGFLHIDCGSVDIPRRMQERGVPFLDFETSLEIYVPFCGTAPLDVQTCVGKTLTCDLYVATATGDVSAVIAAGGHPVAYMSGNMAESLPISSSGYGMYLAACKSTWGNGVSQVMNQLTGGTTSTIKNVNQAALNETLSYGQTGGWGQSELLAESYNNPAIGRGMAGAASAKGVAAIGLTTTALNIANAASTGYEQYQRVKNASYTSVSGSFTSCAAWNYPFTPYVKITRPHKQIPTGGRGDYKHTAAIPLVETRSLSGAPGLTTCVNPDVSGIANATAQEKDIIYRALVNGVIV